MDSECSSSEDELDLGLREVSHGWRAGKPVQVSAHTKPDEKNERLDKCVNGLRTLQRKLEERPSFVNDELRQEIEWATQVKY